jgi:hypothetical protein
MILSLDWKRNFETCKLEYSAPNHMGQEQALAQRILYYLVELEGTEEPLLFSGEYVASLSDRCSSPEKCLVGFGHNYVLNDWGFGTSIHDPEKKLGKKLRKKDLKKITLVLAGDIKGYASDPIFGTSQRMDLFGGGRKITKVVYEKN